MRSAQVRGPKSRLLLTVTVFAAALLPVVALEATASGVVAPTAASPGGTQAPPDVLAQQAMQLPLVEVASRLQQLNSQGLLDDYAGTILNTPSGQIDLYQTDTSTAWQSAASGLLPVDAVHVHQVVHSWSDMTATTSEITDKHAVLDAAGVSLSSWGPDIASNKVTVGVRGSVPVAQAALDALVGLGQTTAYAESTTRQATDRYSDIYPWSGADQVSDTHENCTSGPGLRGTNGSDYIFEAGHCYTQNDAIQTHGVAIGTVTNRNPFINNGYDAELIKARNDGDIWDTDNHTIAQVGSTSVSPGTVLCKSGAETSQQCNIKVVGSDRCVSGVGGFPATICGEQQAARAAGSTINAGGDSGGPLYYYSGGGVEIVGSSSFNSNPYGCTTHSGYNSNCSDSMGYADIGPSLGALQASVIGPH